MRLGRIYSVLRGLVIDAYRRITYRPGSLEAVHEYWRSPWDGANEPEGYAEGEPRSRFLVDLIQSLEKDPETSLLEIGCNIGRNLHYLFESGYHRLYGIEINREAIEKMRIHYPELVQATRIWNAPVEECIRELPSRGFDVVFTMSVLQCIHRDSEWIFRHVARITKKYLITIEDEKGRGLRHFPRSYKRVFEKNGMIHIKGINCGNVEGLSGNFKARVFKPNPTHETLDVTKESDW
jgi:SAM-dependent methyltransferase